MKNVEVFFSGDGQLLNFMTGVSSRARSIIGDSSFDVH